MSTSETWTQDVCSCPCGLGKIARHVTTQDNPWSSADIAYTVECEVCVKLWRGDEHGRLTNIPQEAANRAAYANYRSLMLPAENIAKKLAEKYFGQFDAKSKKAELEEMRRLGIASMSYRNYLAGRKTAGPGDLCSPLRNRQWLQELAAQSGDWEDLNAMLVVADKAESAWKASHVEKIRIEATE